MRNSKSNKGLLFFVEWYNFVDAIPLRNLRKRGCFTMGFYYGALLFVGMTLMWACMVPVVYFQLRSAVLAEREVPGWVYKLGHAMHGRGTDRFEDLTTPEALREARLFLLSLFLGNILIIAYKYHIGLNLYAALYFALRAEFALVLVSRILVVQGNNLWCLFHRHETIHYYAASMAVWGTAFFTSFSLLLTLGITGVPAPPLRVQIADSTLTPGISRGKDLLAAGFSLDGKSADTDVEFAEIKGVYDYKALTLELRRDGKCYGRVRLVPNGKQHAKLKDCVLVDCYFTPEDEGFSEVAVQGKKIAELKAQDFQEQPPTELFGIEAPDVKETVQADFVLMRLQTEPYTLFTSYVFQASFTMEGEPLRYKVQADHTRWE